MKKILLANHYDEASFKVLKSFIPRGFSIQQLPSVSEKLLKELIYDADYLIASGRLRIGASVLSRASKLKMISRTGIGLDAIDLEELARKGISLYFSPGVNAESVAEHTVLLILAALRNLPHADGSTKKGEWLKREIGIRSHELAGKKVYIVGLGNIGKRVARLLEPFGCEICGSDNVEKGRFPNDLVSADVVSLHCPLTPSTRHLLDSDALSRLKKGCVVINTSRGGLIDERALASSLADGHVGYACLDVREQEPPCSLETFEGIDNIVLTPHIAGITNESFSEMMKGAVSRIVCFDNGDLKNIEKYRVEY